MKFSATLLKTVGWNQCNKIMVLRSTSLVPCANDKLKGEARAYHVRNLHAGEQMCSLTRIYLLSSESFMADRTGLDGTTALQYCNVVSVHRL